MRLVLLMLIFAILLSCGGNLAGNREGEALYKVHCANCHMEDGTGLEALYPPLAKSDMLQNMGVTVACIIRNGLEGQIIVNGVEYDNVMLPNNQLSAVDIANIINYINNSWGNENDFVALKDVEEVLGKCSK